MYIKYLRMLSGKHWAKVMLPVILLAAVFFLKGFMTGQVDSYFSAKRSRAADIFKVQMGDEIAAFADALSKERGISAVKPADVRSMLQSEFIQRQRNSPKPPEKPAAAVKNAGAAEVPEEMPPAPFYSVSSIFIGKSRSFAVVNDKIFKIGDKLDSGETIISIEKGKVLIKGKWGDRWLFVKY